MDGLPNEMRRLVNEMASLGEVSVGEGELTKACGWPQLVRVSRRWLSNGLSVR